MNDSEIVDAIILMFPGLINDLTSVNGADLTQELSILLDNRVTK